MAIELELRNSNVSLLASKKVGTLSFGQHNILDSANISFTSFGWVGWVLSKTRKRKLKLFVFHDEHVSRRGAFVHNLTTLAVAS